MFYLLISGIVCTMLQLFLVKKLQGFVDLGDLIFWTIIGFCPIVNIGVVFVFVGMVFNEVGIFSKKLF